MTTTEYIANQRAYLATLVQELEQVQGAIRGGAHRLVPLERLLYSDVAIARRVLASMLERAGR